MAAAAIVPTSKLPIAISKSELLKHAERALEFCYVIAYAQGMHQLSKASVELSMNIPVTDVIQVWKAGCIIRSAMLENFYQAFQKNGNLENLLLDSGIAELIKATHADVKKIAATAIESGIAIPGMLSALAYFEAILQRTNANEFNSGAA